MFQRSLTYLVFIFLFGALCTAPVRASELELKEYPGARVVFRAEENTEDYRLALGTFRKTDDAWQAERQRMLEGKLTRFTLELPANHSARAGFDFYLDQLKQLNRRELFSCSARDCGASNTWANNHFKIIQLYGLDQYQYYGAYEVMTDSATPFYVSLYAVRRGNKRVYVQVDILHSDRARVAAVEANPGTVASLLQSNGFYVFPAPIIDNSDGLPHLKISATHVQTLVAVMKRQPAWRIGLVGHDYQAANLSQQQRQSLAYAEQLKAALINDDIAADRLATHGLGSLAPAGRDDLSARVEVVLLP